MKSLNKVPIVTIDPTLAQYRDKGLFPEKLAKANEMLKTAQLPAKKSVEYLHYFDLSDQLKCANFFEGRVLYSLGALQIFVPEGNPGLNPTVVAIERLSDPGFLSCLVPINFKMLRLLQAAKLRHKATRSKQEEEVVKIADLEIAFEVGRRQFAPRAPSRLSCLYLVNNDEEGRVTLGQMFYNPSRGRRPNIVTVVIFDKINETDVLRCDPRWLERFHEEPEEKPCIAAYWSGAALDENQPSWEYLLEGSIKLMVQSEVDFIDQHVKENIRKAQARRKCG